MPWFFATQRVLPITCEARAFAIVVSPNPTQDCDHACALYTGNEEVGNCTCIKKASEISQIYGILFISIFLRHFLCSWSHYHPFNNRAWFGSSLPSPLSLVEGFEDTTEIIQACLISALRRLMTMHSHSSVSFLRYYSFFSYKNCYLIIRIPTVVYMRSHTGPMLVDHLGSGFITGRSPPT